MYALHGFSLSGRSNLIAVVRAATDEEAAKKLGGQLVNSPTIASDQVYVYANRLPQQGEGWNLFRFGNDDVTADAAMKRLGELTKQPAPPHMMSVQSIAAYSDHLVLARTPFLEE